MKNILFGLIALIGFSATAQDVKGLSIEDFPEVIEITIAKRFLSDNVNVEVDAGQDTAIINFAGRKNYALTKEGSNNRIEFQSTADALNFFKKHGYEVTQQNGRPFVGRSNSALVKLLFFPFTITRGQRLILSKADMM